MFPGSSVGTTALTLLICIGLSAAVYGADTSWQNTPGQAGDWFTAGHWSSGVPDFWTSTDIDNAGTAQISAGAAEAKYIYVGLSNTGTLEHSGGSLAINEAFNVALLGGSTGTYQLSATGQLLANGNINIGSSGEGTFLQTGGSASGEDMNVGWSHIGHVNQSGGTIMVDTARFGVNSGSTGTYELSGTGSIDADFNLIVGFVGDGEFTQTAGMVDVTSNLFIARESASNSTYDLGGSGSVLSKNIYVGYGGMGAFTQTGGSVETITALSVGSQLGSDGSYEVSSGTVVSPTVTIGNSGTGVFTQLGGTVTVDILTLGLDNNLGDGTYAQSNGALMATTERVGVLGVGEFLQTGGSNTMDFLHVSSSGRYEYSGGTLQISDSLFLAGTLDFDNAAVALNMPDGSFADLRGGQINNGQNASMSFGIESLVLLSAGFDPSTSLSSYVNNGVDYVVGTTLHVPAGKGFRAKGEIDDHVVVEGWIANRGDVLKLKDGLEVLAGGSVELSNWGSLIVDDVTSGLFGGQLSMASETIGLHGTGEFTHTTGTHSITTTLEIGYWPGSDGTYELNGDGVLNVKKLDVGFSGGGGEGNFVQSDGTVITESFNIGGHDPSVGTYTLSGSGELSAQYAIIADRGLGTFQHTGGTVNIAGNLFLADDDPGVAVYELSGGDLSADAQFIGYEGTATFNQTGGVNTIADALYLGFHLPADGTYQLSNTGQLTAPYEYIGDAGDGSFEQSGGTNTVDVEMIIIGTGSSYDLSGGDLTSPKEHLVGSSLFVQSGGTNTVGYLRIDDGSRYEYQGGQLNIQSGLGNQGELDLFGNPWSLAATGMILNLADGDVLNGQNASVNLGANSLVILSAGMDPALIFNQYSNAGTTHVAGSPLAIPVGTVVEGCADISDRVDVDGTVTAATGGYINVGGGVILSSTGSVDLGSGLLNVPDADSAISGGQLTAGSMRVVNGASNQLLQTGGDVQVTDVMFVGTSSAAPGGYTITGGTLSTGFFHVGSGNTGVLNISGPSAIVSTNKVLEVNFWGTVNMSDGILSGNSLRIESGGTFNFTGGTIDVDHIINRGQFNGNQPLQLDGATFSGDGVTDVDVINDGVISPGGSIGTMQLQSNYTQDATGSLEIELDETSNDKVDIAGNAALDGLLKLILLNNFDPQVGDMFEILTATGGVAGVFSEVDGVLTDPVAGEALAVIYSASDVTLEVALAGDIDRNDAIDFDDLDILAPNYKVPGVFIWIDGDFNGDSVVNRADLDLMAINFGISPTTEPLGLSGKDLALLIPEPATLTMLAVLGGVLLRRKDCAARQVKVRRRWV